jgi:sialate O-acetylesterase
MRSILTFLLLVLAQNALPKVVLPDVLSENMVLQQNSYIKLWGIAKPHKCIQIKVSWSDKVYKYCTKKDGAFLITVKTPEASFTPQKITFTEGKIVTVVNNVLIGEVWFCSGQSNMEMTFKGFNNQPIEGAEKAISEADPNNGVRMLVTKRYGAERPTRTAEGKWMLSTEQNVSKFSAVAYHFALKLRSELNVPVGIINSSWGGSSVEGWMNKDLVDNYTDLDLKAEIPENENWKKPNIMFNGMLKPYTDYVIKGFCWYQGESNIDRYATYASKLKEMVSLWRFEWGLGTLPFYIVEIAPCEFEHPTNAAKLREAQYNASTIIENCGFVSTSDLVRPEESKVVHPSQKAPIGERLANQALFNTYKKDSICAKSPNYFSHQLNTQSITVHFENCQDGLQPSGFTGNTVGLIGFEIAGEDKVFYPANAVLGEDEKSVILQSDQVPYPAAARYCFKTYAVGNTQNSCGLPLIPFRTDDWND